MKMLKKIAAAIMAVAMATLMLTACGEDSAPSYRLQKIVEANQKSGKVYSEVVVYDTGATPATVKFAVDGEKMFVNTGTAYDIVIKDNACYILSQGQYRKMEVPADVVSAGKVTVPSADIVKSIKVIPEYKIEATGETMYAESVVVDGQQVVYCFNGDKLAYIVETVSGKTTTLKVNKWINEIPEEIQNKIDLKGYKEYTQQ
ncbi:hypothetical protein J3353_05720 [Faecalibacterium sp. Marseille-Q4137]|uniref:hypothetical protein n=1 Tax=Faecalibacterium sp. Marseille-Q4137 TaxID=2817021 RepID=UPI001A9B003D|nr:hypothetical protein [Faecalibacterium sp. Marseille-Q4137]MBO1302505.1 hypothetical protein [Faecalibacterium sp. Marseille-Q4137]